jgi:hypothetical protein
MRVTVTGLRPNAHYNYQARVSAGDLVSEWSTVWSLNTTKDVVPPAPVTNLAGTTNNGAFKFTWTPPTTNADGTALTDLKGYVVVVSSPLGTTSRTVHVTSPEYSLTAEDVTSIFFQYVNTITLTVSAEDWSGNASTTVAATVQKAKPMPVTNLTWTAQGTSFVGTWTAPTQDTAGNTLTNLKDYMVGITAGIYTRYFFVATANFEFSIELNRKTFVESGLFTTPQGALTISVAARDSFDETSTTVSLLAQNAPPAVPTGLAGTAGQDQVALKWNAVADLDVTGYQIWVNSTNSLGSATKAWAGDGTSYVHSTVAYSTDHYFWVTAVDGFGQTNFSTSVGPFRPTSGFGVDNTPPAVPTGLTGTSGVDPNNPYGTGAYIDASWTANASGDGVAGYRLRVSQSASGPWDYMDLPAEATSARINFLQPNKTYYIGVQAYDAASNRSAFSTNVTKLTAKDAGIPANPGTLSVTGYPSSFVATWPENTEVDVAGGKGYYEFTYSTTSDFSANNIVRNVTSGIISVTGLAQSTPYYLRVRTFDASGNASAGYSTATITLGTPASYTSDGLAPVSSPTPTVTPMYQALEVRWLAVSNPDPVTYKVFIDTVPNFVTSPTNRALDVDGTFAIIKTNPATGQPLQYGTTYYVKIVAKDRDGSAAAPGGEVSAMPVQIANLDVGPNAIAGLQLASGSVTTEKLTVGSVSASLVPNGGFEDAPINAGDIASGWNNGGGNGTRVAGVGASGGFALRAQASGSAAAVSTAIFPIKAGERLVLSVSHRSNSASTGIYYRLQYYDANKVAIVTNAQTLGIQDFTSNQDLGAASANYTDSTYVLSAAAGVSGTPVYAQFQFYNVTGDVYVDNIDLRRVVISAQIADGAITTDKLMANAVTAGKILADTITSNEIASNAITTNELSANAVSADKIQAGAVNTEKLTVASFSDNAMVNGSLEEMSSTDPTMPAGWIKNVTLSTGGVVLDTTPANVISGTRSFKLSPGTTTNSNSNIIALINNAYTWTVVPGDQWYISFSAYASIANSTINVQGFNISNTIATNLVASTIGTTVARYEIVLTVPAGMKDLAPFFNAPTTNPAGTNIWVDDFVMRRVVTGTSIANGAITTNKMSANSIDASVITTGTLNGDRLIGNTVDAGVLKANTAFTTNLTVASGFTIGTYAGGPGFIKSYNYDGVGNGFQLSSNGLDIQSGTIAARALVIQDSNNIVPPAWAGFSYRPSYYTFTSTNNSGGTTTATIDTTYVKHGSASVKVTTSAGMNDGYVYLSNDGGQNISVDGNTTYIVSVWCYHNQGAGQVVNSELYVRFDDNGQHIGSGGNIPNATWTRIYFTFTTNAATRNLTSRVDNNTPSTTIWFNGLQIERKIANSDIPSPWTPPGATTIDGAIIRTGSIQSNNVSSIDSTQPMWAINMNGNMSINDAQIRGKIVVGSPGYTSNSAVSIASANYGAGVPNSWAIKGDGTFSIQGSGGSVTLDSTGLHGTGFSLDNYGLSVTGTINATGGTINGNLTINGGDIQANANGGTSNVIMNANGLYAYNGYGYNTAYINTTGSLYAMQGQVGGWYLNATSLYNGNLTIDASQGLITSGSGNTTVSMQAGVGIWAGDTNFNSAYFRVNTQGQMVAVGANIIGDMHVGSNIYGTNYYTTSDTSTYPRVAMGPSITYQGYPALIFDYGGGTSLANGLVGPAAGRMQLVGSPYAGYNGFVDVNAANGQIDLGFNGGGGTINLRVNSTVTGLLTTSSDITTNQGSVYTTTGYLYTNRLRHITNGIMVLDNASDYYVQGSGGTMKLFAPNSNTLYARWEMGSGGSVLMGSSNGGTVYIGLNTSTPQDLRAAKIYQNGVQVSSTFLSKTNVEPHTYGLKELKKIKPVKFDRDGDTTKLGLIAEEIAEHIPEAAAYYGANMEEEEGSLFGYDVTAMLSLLVKTSQELAEQNDELRARLEKLEKKK